MDATPNFDTAAAIATYRHMVALREISIDELSKEEFDGMARRLREAWKNWHGTDSLHEKTFGEAAE
jgi:hypothetical protein